MRKLSMTTALVSSLGVVILGAAGAQADDHAEMQETVSVEQSAEAEIEAGVTIEQIETADQDDTAYDELNTVEATGEALEELDITDEDEANLTVEARAEINALNEITSILIDAEAIYMQASDMPDKNEGVRVFLKDLAAERESQTVALQQRVMTLGGEPDQFGEAIGTTHRAFASLRTLFDNDTEVAIEEVLRGERYIVEEIGKVLEGDISEEGEAILEALRADVMDDIVRLEDLDDMA